MKGKLFTARSACASALCLLGIAMPASLWAAERDPTQTPGISNPARSVHHRAAGTLKIARSPQKPDTIYLIWKGPMYPPMAKQFAKAIAEHRATSSRFVLLLNSPGGSVAEGERVIALLQDLRQTHRLDTLVQAGWTCGSMCPFVFAQGERRFAAPASMWLFHEVSVADPATGKPLTLNRERWLGLIDKYFVPAGLSETWLEKMKTVVVSRDYFVSGDSLIQHHSGLITGATSNAIPRNIPQG